MIGQTVSHYRILARLGEGGMGVVYEAEDLRLPRHVALKFLPARHFDDHAARERFEREARAASALSHPHICTVHDVAEHDGQPFIVMELLRGQTLRDRIHAGPIPVEEQLKTGLQVADALEAAHIAGIVHRDVKPANIFLTERGDAKVLDFGVVRFPFGAGPDSVSQGSTLERLTTPGMAVGTLSYMSPEQVLGQKVDARSDVFSLGVVLYEMATGKMPFQGDSMGVVFDAILHKAPTSPVRLNPSLPPELERIVNRCLEKDPAKRWRSAAELRNALAQCLEVVGQRSGARRVVARLARKPWAWAAAVLAVAALAAGVVAYTRQRAGVRWAREEALPEIRRLSESGLSGWGAAFRLAERAQAVLPDDPELRRLLEAISAESEILTEPAGASVWVKAYEELASPWQLIGTTPIRGRRMPAAYFRWRIEKEGFVPLARVEWGASWDLSRGTVGPSRHHWVLDREGALPPDMVRVEGGDGLPDFLADRNEVTNRAFKAFIDAGGYRDRRYWTHAFEKDGRTLSWEEALRLLVDRSGQPGPAGWEAGDYPDGDDDLPVGGVSWYEAAAYAEFAGKSLPTVRHWWVATGQYYARTADFMGLLLLPISNFAGRGPMAVGTSEALSPFGTADMAGNVREWCWNVSELGRSVRGGAWNDQVYMYMYVTQAAPFDRSEKNGFRCVRYPDPSRTPREAFAPLARGAVRDFSREKPVPAEVFAAYRERFSYDPTDLAAKVEARNESSPDWIEETVSFSAAYGGERVRGRLFLPRTGRPPFQAVLYCPGFSAQLSTNSDLIVDRIEFKENLAFLVKGGRAVLYPVYKGTYERGIGASFAPDEGTRSFAAWMVQLVQDARRSVDYLQSRPDIDGTRVAFYGFSFGGRWANLVLAVEDRFKAAIVHSGGLRSTQHPRPDVDLFNFAPRVRTPVLMLHGRYDLAVPLQTEALPMFRLLGTPTDDKHLIVVDTDHWIPRPVLIRESLAWLDKYLGPVETATAAGAEPPVGAQPTPNP